MKRQPLMILAVGLFVLLVMAGFATSFKANAAVKKAGPVQGLKAPDFTLQDLDGQKITLSDVIKNNKVTVVNFWATWCPPCRAEIPDLIDFNDKYSTRKVSLLGIDLQEEPVDVKTFVKKNKMNYPVLTDIDGKAGQLYNIYAIPTTFFIDSNGKVRDKIEGGTDLETLETKVKALLKE